jgi:hypothetical protein
MNALPVLPVGILAVCIRHDLVGSRITCSPPPTSTDQDVLVLVKPEAIDELWEELFQIGFELDGSDPGDVTLESDNEFQSFSHGELNLIITASETFYSRFMAATSVAKHLNLMDKCDRVALFQAVLYGNACT